MNIQEIKSHLPIKKLLAYYNISVNHNHHIHCPFHDDKTPSCRIYEETNTFYCFACGKSGDVIDFIMYKETLTKHRAILRAKEIAEIISSETQNFISHEIFPKEPQPDYNALFPIFLENIERSETAKKYCQKRALDYKTLNIGYNSGKLFNKLKNCIIFPLKDKEGKITSLYGRCISESKIKKEGKHFCTENRTGLYPGYPEENTETIIITEAIIDAATLLQIPEITEHHKILSCYGNLSFTREMQEVAKSLKNLKEIIIFFDGDQGGVDGTKHISEILHQIMPGIKITVVPTPENEDINSLFIKYSKEHLINLIKKRKPINEILPSFSNNLLSGKMSETEQTTSPSARAISPETKSKTSSSTETFLTEETKSNNPSPLNTSIAGRIIYETITARYIIKGELPKRLDSLFVSLDIQNLETGIKYRTRLELYEEKQIKKESREASEKLNLRADLIENDLSLLIDYLEEHREKLLKEEIKKEDIKKRKTCIRTFL